MSRKRTTSQSGMTLTELLIVVAIIGIVAMIALPNFNAMMKSWEASSAVSEMVSMINLARQLSVNRRETHLFVASISGHNWQLLRVAGAEVLKVAELPESTAVTAQAAFAFDANGACTSPTTYTGTTPSTQFIRVDAAITGSRTDRYTLEVSPVGRVKSTKEIIE